MEEKDKVIFTNDTFNKNSSSQVENNNVSSNLETSTHVSQNNFNEISNANNALSENFNLNNINLTNLNLGSIDPKTKTLITIILLTVFGPLGLITMWYWNDDWKTSYKIVVTILTILPIFLIAYVYYYYYDLLMLSL